MENFIVSARKYRPLHFNTVVGQGHVTGTLKNAIKNNQLAQAFLFCGPRGVGKTTCARILAKTINCQQITPDYEACDTCESCLAFRKGASLNIHELDAASNNSVDDIRSLVEQVRYPPQSGKYKIYIIDEVHMLSQSAFNAFLKTLEEPPSYAIFILATTEKHKIIPTILSRCQIFDFNRIRVEDIAGHLAHIAEKEQIAYEADGLHLIAQKSDGALRDALSMFDQIVSFSGGNLSYQAVIDNLNILDYDYYFRLTRSLLDEDIPASLLLFDEILGKGFDGNNFINGLCAHFRNLLVCREERTVQLLEVSEGIRQRYLEQAREASTGFLLSALNIGNQCDINYRLSKNPRLQVELALMKMCHINSVIQAGAAPRDTPPVADEGLKKKRVTPPSPPSGTASPEDRLNPGSKPEDARTPENNASLTEPPAPGPRPAAPTETAAPTGPAPAPAPEAGITPSASLQWKQIPKMKVPSLTGTSGISASKSAPAEQKAGDSRESLPEQPFHEEQLLIFWNEYADRMKAEGRANIHTLMTAFPPSLGKDFIVKLKVVNKVQQATFLEEKQDLMSFLRKALHNYRLDIETVLHEGQDNRRRLYTSTDKFNYLAEKNPSLIELRKRLDLDIDF